MFIDQARELGKILRERELTIATAESLTAGNLSAAITSVDGASGYFVGGLTAYTLHQKALMLGVDREHAAEVDCVSDRVAREMAVGARRLFQTDIGVATTGYASRPDGSAWAFIAVATEDGVESIRWYNQPGQVAFYGAPSDRVGAQLRVVHEAVQLLLKVLGD